LDAAIGLGALEWLSPLEGDAFSEYSDAAFLDRLGISLDKRALSDFWPHGGPVWDGLARTVGGEPVLVEAKAHVPEMFSSCGAKALGSVAKIRAALDETRGHLGADTRHDWMTGFYQYANRLAHAHLLNELNDVTSHLVFINFYGDADVHGPELPAEWSAATVVLHEALGISGKVPRYVRHVHVDVSQLTSASS
jgi:hypothetical protein